MYVGATPKAMPRLGWGTSAKMGRLTCSIPVALATMGGCLNCSINIAFVPCREGGLSSLLFVVIHRHRFNVTEFVRGLIRDQELKLKVSRQPRKSDSDVRVSTK